MSAKTWSSPNTRKTKKGSERSERGAVSRLWYDRPPFLFLIFLSRACACFYFLFCRPSLYLKGECTWPSVCRWWAHTIYCMYTWEFDFVRPNCPPVSYSRPPSSASVERSKVFTEGSLDSNQLTLWKDDGVGLSITKVSGLTEQHKFASPPPTFKRFKLHRWPLFDIASLSKCALCHYLYRQSIIIDKFGCAIISKVWRMSEVCVSVFPAGNLWSPGHQNVYMWHAHAKQNSWPLLLLLFGCTRAQRQSSNMTSRDFHLTEKYRETQTERETDRFGSLSRLLPPLWVPPPPHPDG